jgi:hypothetical protein
MGKVLKAKVLQHLDGRVAAVGFAPVERFADAPEGHHPSDVCKNAKRSSFGHPHTGGRSFFTDYKLYALHAPTTRCTVDCSMSPWELCRLR